METSVYKEPIERFCNTGRRNGDVYPSINQDGKLYVSINGSTLFTYDQIKLRYIKPRAEQWGVEELLRRLAEREGAEFIPFKQLRHDGTQGIIYYQWKYPVDTDDSNLLQAVEGVSETNMRDIREDFDPTLHIRGREMSMSQIRQEYEEAMRYANIPPRPASIYFEETNFEETIEGWPRGVNRPTMPHGIWSTTDGGEDGEA